MQMFRRFLVALMVVALAGCGIGGSNPSPTAPPTTEAKATPTEKAEATQEPEATEEPEATAKPSTGGSAGAIPAPPDSEPYVKGTDATVDIALETVEQQINSGDVAFSETQFYISTATAKEIEDFYDDEMSGAGFDGPKQSQDQDIGKVLGYPSADGTKVAVVGAFDLQVTGVQGLIVITTVGEPKTGGGSSSAPTEESGSGSTGGSTVAGDIGDIPAPPSSDAYSEGDDPIADIFVSTFTDTVASGFEENGVAKQGQAEFVTTEDGAAIKDFYDKEMEALGWEAQPQTPNETAQILNYVKADGANAQLAVIMSVDLAEINPASKGKTLVIILLAGPK
ncbi:MAG TPA: hypothetical protein VGE07_17995 [Herpetosiphonaceae bacterium]